MYPGEIPVVTDDFRRGCWPLCLFVIALLRFCLLLSHPLPCECTLSMGNIGGEGSLGHWIYEILMVLHVAGEDDDDVYVRNFVTRSELDFHLELLNFRHVLCFLEGTSFSGWLAPLSESSLEIP